MVRRARKIPRREFIEIEFVAATVAATGDKDETMKYLRQRDPDLIFIQDEPMFDFLHSDPRYQALVKRWAFRSINKL